MFLGLTTAQQKAVEQYYPQGAKAPGFCMGSTCLSRKRKKAFLCKSKSSAL